MVVFFAVPYILSESTETFQFITVITFVTHRYVTFPLVVAVNLLFGGVKLLSVLAFQVIAYGASLARYIYDGMIWRIRRTRVSQDVGIGPAANAQPAIG